MKFNKKEPIMIDLSNSENVTDMVFSLGKMLEACEYKQERIILQLGAIDLERPQMLGLKSLILATGSELVCVHTESSMTKLTAIELDIVVYEENKEQEKSNTIKELVSNSNDVLTEIITENENRYQEMSTKDTNDSEHDDLIDSLMSNVQGVTQELERKLNAETLNEVQCSEIEPVPPLEQTAVQEEPFIQEEPQYQNEFASLSNNTPFLEPLSQETSSAEHAPEQKLDDNITGAYISDIVDESDRSGMRAVIKLKKDAKINAILNYLYKNSDLQCAFNANMVAIADGKPKLLSLREILQYYVVYQQKVIYNRTKYDLEAALKKEHILEGLLIAIKNIDEVIKIIKSSKNTTEAKIELMNRFTLTDVQAQAILDMRLARLTNLEVNKLETELARLKDLIKRYTEILKSPRMQMKIVRKEILEIAKSFGKGRQSNFMPVDAEVDEDDDGGEAVEELIEDVQKERKAKIYKYGLSNYKKYMEINSQDDLYKSFKNVA